VVEHLRKSFPASVTAETLKKLGYAPNNESYLISILRFIQVIDDKGVKTDKASEIFSKHEDAEFQKGFAELMKAAYADLFSLHGENAWALNQHQLISYFRTADQSSAIVGRRQASVFQALAALSGKASSAAPVRKVKAANGEAPAVKAKRASTRNDGAALKSAPPASSSLPKGRDIGLTVRIEINLPAEGDQETYDRIFKSIRENLING
jgi:hypothetical protein